jgi:hypothetical protein
LYKDFTLICTGKKYIVHRVFWLDFNVTSNSLLSGKLIRSSFSISTKLTRHFFTVNSRCWNCIEMYNQCLIGSNRCDGHSNCFSISTCLTIFQVFLLYPMWPYRKYVNHFRIYICVCLLKSSNSSYQSWYWNIVRTLWSFRRTSLLESHWLVMMFNKSISLITKLSIQDN